MLGILNVCFYIALDVTLAFFEQMFNVDRYSLLTDYLSHVSVLYNA